MRGSSDVRASHPTSTPLSFDVVLWEINVAYVCVMIYLRIVRLRRSRSRSHQPLRGSGGPFSEDVGAAPLDPPQQSSLNLHKATETIASAKSIKDE